MLKLRQGKDPEAAVPFLRMPVQSTACVQNKYLELRSLWTMQRLIALNYSLTPSNRGRSPWHQLRAKKPASQPPPFASRLSPHRLLLTPHKALSFLPEIPHESHIEHLTSLFPERHRLNSTLPRSDILNEIDLSSNPLTDLPSNPLTQTFLLASFIQYWK